MNVTSQIGLLNNLYSVFGIVAIILLVLSVFLFFKLNIKGVIGYLTGRTAQIEIKRMETSSYTGGLNSNNKSKKNKSDKKVNTPPVTMPYDYDSYSDDENSVPDVESNRKVVTSAAEYAGESETEILNVREKIHTIKFDIIKNVIIVNTDERI